MTSPLCECGTRLVKQYVELGKCRTCNLKLTAKPRPQSNLDRNLRRREDYNAGGKSKQTKQVYYETHKEEICQKQKDRYIKSKQQLPPPPPKSSLKPKPKPKPKPQPKQQPIILQQHQQQQQYEEDSTESEDISEEDSDDEF